MKTQLILTALFGASLQSMANAATVPACYNTPANAPAGTVCVTEAGFQFKRYENPQTHQIGWEDIGAKGQGGVGGKIWYDVAKAGVNVQEAANFCASERLDMPEAKDAQIGLKHGLTEVLKDDVSARFWTLGASQDPQIGLFALHPYFTGGVSTGYYTLPFGEVRPYSDSLNVRCVGVSGVNSGS